ncbi:hypothetical protein KKC44_03530 [Patescibacteria group bacterium]|nr:hypothetical protein [Patescibacteria group bacterium]MBU2259655.1 hypothetical protein [Patescibacteria group bacterium]
MNQVSPTNHRTGEQALEEADVYVTKIGGTRAAELQSNADLIESRREQGKKQILAISAIRSTDERYNELTHQIVTDREMEKLGKRKSGFNTTSHLILIADRLQEGDISTAWLVLDRIEECTKEIVAEQVDQDPSIAEKSEAIHDLNITIADVLDELQKHIISDNIGKVRSVGEDRLVQTTNGHFSITGVGEDLARAIYVQYLRLRNQQATEVREQDLSVKVFGDEPQEFAPDSHEREQVLDDVTAEMRGQIGELLQTNDVLVSGGYYPGVGSERGYSELTAALLAVAAKELNQRVVCLIEKDYPIRSGDPRTLENTLLVKRMKYALAFELFGNRIAGADSDAVHAPALEVLALNKIDTVVFNPADLAQGTTLIQDFEDEGLSGVEIVASRSIPDAILISSSKMLGPGFLQEVGGWFKDCDISIVHTPTSEITLSLTFNNGQPDADQIAEFETFLEKRYGKENISVKPIPRQSIVYCLGNKLKKTDTLLRAGIAFRSAGVEFRMGSQGYGENAMVFSVDDADVEKTTKMLHKVCVEFADSSIEDILQMTL